MSEDKLTLAKRELTGKKLKSLREQGIIPSVIYGGDKDPVLTESPYNETEKIVLKAGYHSPIDLAINGKEQMALVKNVDIDPVKRTIRNIEFQAISADKIVEATTPIVLVGFESSEANKIHLNILQVLEEVEVKAKPADLPSRIEIDASKLAAVDNRLTIADLKLPKGVELADKELDPEQVIANVYDAAAEAAAREAEDEADKAREAAAAAEESPETPAGEAAPAATEPKAE
ncbi:MAG: 50S ribosomal protein L25 [Candidatus Nomurabacteria bacterium]|jgi:large subunit ribosomal protein L25|nr:50S ribosomal protein L25 [Candidatus Nomurabacteria bacterium]